MVIHLFISDMEYYERVPPELAEHVSLPGKWDVGGACPNCGEGVLFLIDKGADLDAQPTVSDWDNGGESRFEVQCSEYEYGTLGCDFEFSLGTVSATISEDWSEAY